MSAEDRLRDLLRGAATEVVPTGDGLARIQERVARRRRFRLFLLPCAALATAGATAAFFLLGPGTGPTTLIQQPGDQPSTTSAPSPSTPTASLYDGPAVWPFTSAAQATAWAPGGSYPWAESKREVVKHFLLDHLKLTTLQAEFGLVEVAGATTCTGCEVLQLETTENGEVAEVTVAAFDTAAGNKVFTVVGVTGGDLTVTRPGAGAALTSPTSVSGRITGVDEHVLLRLVTTPGSQIAQGGAPAGSAVPWQGTLSWTDTSWSTAAIVGTTGSFKDGSLTRLVVVPVNRATGASAGPSFVGITDGHVSLFDASTGDRLKQLTFPPAGKTDVRAAWAAGTVLWVRSAQTGCDDALHRLDNGTATTVVPAGRFQLGSPQLSPNAGWMAWVQTPCSGGSPSIVVTGGGAPGRTLEVPSGTSASILDVREDGALLVHTNDRAGGNAGTVALVPGGSLTLNDAVPLAPIGDCYLGGSAAFDGTTPIAVETCLSDSRLVRFTDGGGRRSTGPRVTSLEAPTSLTIRAGVVLLWLAGGDSVGQIARYRDGAVTVLVPNTGCTSVSEPPGCVRAPDW